MNRPRETHTEKEDDMDSNTAAAAATTLTPAEIEQAGLLLRQARDGAIGATRRLSEAHFRFQPGPQQWSIGQILEHIVVVQDLVLGRLRDHLAAAPPAPAGYDAKTIDAIIIQQFPVRLTKVQAPEMIHPPGRMTPAESLRRLRENTAAFEQMLESRSDLRGHALPSPPLKVITKDVYQFTDGYQTILAISAHTERHTKQILEVMANPNFPE
jgi:hypothetical protein